MASPRKLQLKVIYDPVKEGKGVPDVDLVLVHGFGGDLINTWTCKTVEPHVFWPKQLLPRKQPRTRILSFGYDAGDTTVATIRDNARTMLYFLDDQREGDSKSRPIVFLGHCLGGLIIRQAIRFATREEKLMSIASATKSMMFFGTPHGGGDKRGWLKLAKYVGFGRKSRMIDDLGKKTDNLDNIDEDFGHLVGNYKIVNFREGQPLEGMNTVIVNKMSAYEIAGDSVIVGADHLKLCQFEDDDDSTFLRVCQIIKEAVLKAQGQGQSAPKVVAALAAPMLALPWYEYSSRATAAAASLQSHSLSADFVRVRMYAQGPR